MPICVSICQADVAIDQILWTLFVRQDGFVRAVFFDGNVRSLLTFLKDCHLFAVAKGKYAHHAVAVRLVVFLGLDPLDMLRR